MNGNRARLALFVFGALAIAAGICVQTNWLSQRRNEDVLGAVSIVGGLAMLLVAIFDWLGTSGSKE